MIDCHLGDNSRSYKNNIIQQTKENDNHFIKTRVIDLSYLKLSKDSPYHINV